LVIEKGAQLIGVVRAMCAEVVTVTRQQAFDENRVGGWARVHGEEVGKKVLMLDKLQAELGTDGLGAADVCPQDLNAADGIDVSDARFSERMGDWDPGKATEPFALTGVEIKAKWVAKSLEPCVDTTEGPPRFACVFLFAFVSAVRGRHCRETVS